MKTPPALQTLGQELRVIGPIPLLAPLLVALAWDGLAGILQVRHVVHSFVSLVVVVGLEAILPLTAAIVLVSLASRDSALEVLLAVSTSYRRTSLRRMAIVFAWTLLLGLVATWAAYDLFPGAIPASLGLLSLLAVVAPMVWLSVGGVVLAYGLRSLSASSAVLGCIWIAQMAFHSYFAAFGWTQPWFLFATAFAPTAPFWLANRLELIATAACCGVACWLFLGDAERRFRSEDA